MNTKESRVKRPVETVSFYETSYGAVSKPKKVKMLVEVHVESDWGWFEIADEDTWGEQFYAEGELEIADGVLYGYDGIFELPDYIIDILKELNINTEQIEGDLYE
tara:strand:- start:103 stop:417 length:315 start_codon:yes stop_codon:yes gene_type:complete